MKPEEVDESKVCRHVVWNIATQLVKSLPSLIGTTLIRQPVENRAEIHAFTEIVHVSIAKRPVEGFLIGVGTFLTLRFVPRLAIRLMRRNRYQLDEARTSTPTASNRFLRTTRLGLDLAVSGVACYYSSDVCLDPPILAAQIACLPLLEGRSKSSDVMCSIVQKEVGRLPPSFWNQNKELHLQQLGALAYHCARRQQYENKLRADHGLSINEPVSIPNPGVPTIEAMISGKGVAKSTSADDED